VKNLSVRRWMRTGMGWMFRELCRWEVGVRLGWLLINRIQLRLDNLESEVVGGACGAPDRGGISKNGRISNLYRVNLLDSVSAEYRARRGKMLDCVSAECRARRGKMLDCVSAEYRARRGKCWTV